MGFCMEPVGNVSVETRSESFILTHSATWHGLHGYEALEVPYEELPDLLEAISLMVRQRDIPREVVSRIRWMPGTPAKDWTEAAYESGRSAG